MDKKKNPLDMYQQVWDETKAQKQPWRTALNNYQQAYTQMKQQGIMPSTNAPSQVSVETPQETRSIAPNARVKQVQRSNTDNVASTTESTPNKTQASEAQVSEPQASETKERPILTGTGNAFLSAPKGLENDQMSGFRNWAYNIDDYYKNKYNAGIMDIDASNIDNAEDRKKYFEDYGLYTTVSSAISNYDAEVLAEQKKAKEAAEYANTRRLLMEKYLPETIRAMGYANTGLAADAITGIDAAYQNYALNAKESASEAQNDAMKRYQQAISDYQAGKVEEKQKQEETKMQAQEKEYNTFLAAIMDDPNFDVKQLDTALAIGNISQSQYEGLIAKYNEQRESAAATPEGYSEFNITKEQLTTDKIDDRTELIGATAKIPEGGWGTIVAGANTGFTPQELAQNVDAIASSLDHAGESGGKRDKRILDAAQAAMRGNLKDGTIFDINYGSGEDYVIYINGYFYPIEIN